MGLNWKFWKRSAEGKQSSKLTYNDLYGEDGGTTAGYRITQNLSLNLSAVWNGVVLLGGGIASLPFKVYQKTDEGHQVHSAHQANYLISKEPSELYSSFKFWETIVGHVILWGNAYVRIHRRNGFQLSHLEIWHPKDVEVISENGQKFIKHCQTNQVLAYEEYLHFYGLTLDGIVGESPILYQKKMIAQGVASQDYGNTFFENGGVQAAVLETDTVIQPEHREQIRREWRDKHGSVMKGNTTPLLDGGLKYKSILVPPETAQFLGTRQFNVEEISRWLNLPPHLLKDLKHATFSNIEHQSISYVMHTLLPWFRMIEQECDRKLLTEEEKASGMVFTKFNANALMRGDFQSRMEGYSKIMQTGAITPNTIAEWEDLPKVQGGDRAFVQVNLQPLDRIDQLTDAKISSLEKKGQTNGDDKEI